MTNQSNAVISVETLIFSALHHGLNSEPDHEAGDLQEYLRSVWSQMSAELQNSALAHPCLSGSLGATACGEQLLGKPDTPTGDKLLERILATFKEHGSNEGPHAEIQGLQDALRSIWDVLPPIKREQMMNLPCVQETYFNATSTPLFRYVACAHWGHIFGPSSREDMTRWMFDRHYEKVVAAQVEHQSKWIDLEPVPFADLAESLKDNGVSASQDEDSISDDFLYFVNKPSWHEVTKAFEALREQDGGGATIPAPTSR